MNQLFDQPEFNLINGFGKEELNEFYKLSSIEQHKVQMEAVAAAAAFLLSFPNENNSTINNKIINENEQKQQQINNNNINQSLRHTPLQPISQKGNRWIHLGTFKNEEELHLVRNKEKVSKRRTEQLKNGVKIRYRCNTWKRTKCAFQMFSFFNPNDGLFDLYECGEHDHSGRRKLEYELYGPTRHRNGNNTALNNLKKEDFNNLIETKINSKKKQRNLKNLKEETLPSSSFYSLFSLKNEIEKKEQIKTLVEEFGMIFNRESENIFSIRRKDKNELILTIEELQTECKIITKELIEKWLKVKYLFFLIK
ncbi:hypothetical protein Mgra_00000478 [Meloidogyne graminicola]|uniref:WRKY domain-containing protein n=1 Tax=Meloidogyne graminicola TaxID=189291 RepID=A0A8T0A532_9BILA|nr:hypothetical protein Mgra_00000478 [Meloidogyne graminicola]